MAYGGKHRRRRNPLDSIHDPPDPSPRSLPDAARKEWDDAYAEAASVYDKKDLAKRAAWREIKLRWKQSGKKTWARCKNGLCYWPKSRDFPMPLSNLVAIGVLVEYVFIGKNGELFVLETDEGHPPILWWDKKRKALYAFPKQEYPECRYEADFVDPEAIEEYKRWHQRDPDCFDEVPVPDVKIKAVGAADSLSYASDKWNEQNPDPALQDAQQYIHEHWYDVWTWQDTPAERGVPNVIMIQGGELDLHERGLIH